MCIARRRKVTGRWQAIAVICTRNQRAEEISMKKLIVVATGCLVLALSQTAFSQGASNDKKRAPLTDKELAEKNRAVGNRGAMCAQSANRQKLKQGSKEFGHFMSKCLNEKS